ncbi:MAG TPA: GNAT family N-acetyltransferase [Marinagarivorans sp.]
MQYEFSNSIHAIPANQWQALWQTSYPFIQHGFLAALEDSGCTRAESGWQPYHLSLKQDGELVAAMPLYVKTHSYGEYVFDWSWADAYHQHGIHYYPKLLNAIPFTPATGPRVAARSEAYKLQLFALIEQQLAERRFSGFHSLFPSAQELVCPAEAALSATAQSAGGSLRLQQRLGCQFHWFNQNYSDFDDFLADFSSRKRKNIKKERAKVADQGFHITATLGGELNPQDWADFHRLYQRTYQKRSGHGGYLNQSFFQTLGDALAPNILLVRAYLEEGLVAAALYFYDEHTLYGRYWGALQEYDGLHFECCYYRGIEFAITQNLPRFDPGAQGEHKIQRGFVPVLTQSFHRLAHHEFNHAVADFLKQEQQHSRQYCMDARTYLPFKRELSLPNPNILTGDNKPAELTD